MIFQTARKPSVLLAARALREAVRLSRLPGTLIAMMLPAWTAACVALPPPEPVDADAPAVPRSAYSLVVLTDAVGLNTRGTPEEFLRSLYKHPRGTKDGTVGHSWILLEGPEYRLECGYTGEFGVEAPTYMQGVRARMDAGRDNPVAYLWHTFHDGRLQLGHGRHLVTFAARYPLSRAQFNAVRRAVASYPYGCYGLTGAQCTQWVAHVIAPAGLRLRTREEVRIPSHARVFGEEVRFWKDDVFRRLAFQSPDKLEEGLRRHVRRGIAADATLEFRSKWR